MKLIRRDEVIAGFYVLLAVILLVIGGCVLQTIDVHGQDGNSLTETWCATETTPHATYPGTRTITPTWARTLTLTPGCLTCTPTRTPVPPTDTDVPTSTFTATVTKTPTPTKTETKTATWTPTKTPTGTITPTDTPTITATASATPLSSLTPTVTPTGTQPSATPTGTQPIVTVPPENPSPTPEKLPQTGRFENILAGLVIAVVSIITIIVSRKLRKGLYNDTN